MNDLHCPHCQNKNFDGNWCYNNGAYDLEKVTTVDCPNCNEKFAFKPFESIGYDVAETAEEIDD